MKLIGKDSGVYQSWGQLRTPNQLILGQSRQKSLYSPKKIIQKNTDQVYKSESHDSGVCDIKGCGYRLFLEEKTPGFCSEGFTHRCDIRELQQSHWDFTSLSKNSVLFGAKARVLGYSIGEAKGLFSGRCV